MIFALQRYTHQLYDKSLVGGRGIPGGTAATCKCYFYHFIFRTVKNHSPNPTPIYLPVTSKSTTNSINGGQHTNRGPGYFDGDGPESLFHSQTSILSIDSSLDDKDGGLSSTGRRPSSQSWCPLSSISSSAATQ